MLLEYFLRNYCINLGFSLIQWLNTYLSFTIAALQPVSSLTPVSDSSSTSGFSWLFQFKWWSVAAVKVSFFKRVTPKSVTHRDENILFIFAFSGVYSAFFMSDVKLYLYSGLMCFSPQFLEWLLFAPGWVLKLWQIQGLCMDFHTEVESLKTQYKSSTMLAIRA